jgi:hypothetical protein
MEAQAVADPPEASSSSGTLKSGRQFYRELRRFIERASNVPRPFFAALSHGTVSREQLIGYTLEYYHVVRMCPSLLGPAFAHAESKRSRDILQRFFVGELNHDRYLEASLQSVGINRRQLDRLVPLPMTFAMCTSLVTLARYHPVSLKSVLCIFEEPGPTFNDLLKSSAERVKLPSAFYEPLLRHAQLNDEGDHGSITQTLLAEIFVTQEEEIVAKRHAALMIRFYAELEAQVVQYYGDARNPIPRIIGSADGLE